MKKGTEIKYINFSFFISVFMCSGHFLVLSEHCQYKFENTIKKTPKRVLVAPMLLTDDRMNFHATHFHSASASAINLSINLA